MTPIQQAIHLLVGAQKSLLDLSVEIGEGRRVGLDAQTVGLLTWISIDISDVAKLLFEVAKVVPGIPAAQTLPSGH